jgi:hypothetical protein
VQKEIDKIMAKDPSSWTKDESNIVARYVQLVKNNGVFD